MPLGTAIDAYLLGLKLEGKAATTRENYRYMLRRMVRHLGNRRLREIRADDVRQYLASLADSGLEPSSFNTYCTMAKRFFGWLHEQEYMISNPLQGMRVHRQRQKPIKPLTDEQVQRLLAAAGTPLEKAVVMILLDTGARASELCGLRLESIDLERGELWVTGKGNKTRREALNQAPKEALKDYLRMAERVDGAVWPPRWNRWKLARLLDELAERAGIGLIHPHLLRHTWACRFLRAGGDPFALKVLLGHESLVMTERYVESLEQERALSVHKKHPLVA